MSTRIDAENHRPEILARARGRATAAPTRVGTAIGTKGRTDHPDGLAESERTPEERAVATRPTRSRATRLHRFEHDRGVTPRRASDATLVARTSAMVASATVAMAIERPARLGTSDARRVAEELGGHVERRRRGRVLFDAGTERRLAGGVPRRRRFEIHRRVAPPTSGAPPRASTAARAAPPPGLGRTPPPGRAAAAGWGWGGCRRLRRRRRPAAGATRGLVSPPASMAASRAMAARAADSGVGLERLSARDDLREERLRRDGRVVPLDALKELDPSLGFNATTAGIPRAGEELDAIRRAGLALAILQAERDPTFRVRDLRRDVRATPGGGPTRRCGGGTRCERHEHRNPARFRALDRRPHIAADVEGPRARARAREGRGRGVPTREGNLQSAVSRDPVQVPENRGRGPTFAYFAFAYARLRNHGLKSPTAGRRDARAASRRFGFAKVVLFDIIERRGGSRRGYFLAPFGALLDEKLRRASELFRTRSRRARPRPPPPRTFLVASTMPTVDLAIGGLIQCMEAASLGTVRGVEDAHGVAQERGHVGGVQDHLTVFGAWIGVLGGHPKMFESASKVRDGRDTAWTSARAPPRQYGAADPPRARRIRRIHGSALPRPAGRSRTRAPTGDPSVQCNRARWCAANEKRPHGKTNVVSSSSFSPSARPLRPPSKTTRASHPPPPQKNARARGSRLMYAPPGHQRLFDQVPSASENDAEPETQRPSFGFGTTPRFASLERAWARARYRDDARPREVSRDGGFPERRAEGHVQARADAARAPAERRTRRTNWARPGVHRRAAEAAKRGVHEDKDAKLTKAQEVGAHALQLLHGLTVLENPWVDRSTKRTPPPMHARQLRFVRCEFAFCYCLLTCSSAPTRRIRASEASLAPRNARRACVSSRSRRQDRLCQLLVQDVVERVANAAAADIRLLAG